MKIMNPPVWKFPDKVHLGKTLKMQKIRILFFIVLTFNMFCTLTYSYGHITPAANEVIINNLPDNRHNNNSSESLQIRVSGKITDETGNPLPGVTVQVKGTTIGTVTDGSGRYTIDSPARNVTLVFSFIGYSTKEIQSNGRALIDVELKEESVALEEVVVIGYGTQKKADLTGSVSSVRSEQLSKRITTQASQLLQGVTSGVSAIQGSGEPGQDATTLTIRGLGTFSGAGTNPLIIIDGVPGSINSVNPSNIESISVLKDAASSAIYGSRAANGVILIKTKEGRKGDLIVNYESYIGKQEVPVLPQYVDSWVYAEMLNEASKNIGTGAGYTQEEINKYKSGIDRDKYPNKHHLRDLFNSGNGFQTRQNLTLSGGKEDVQYLFSAGYLRQNGNIAKNYYDRYDLRLNVNSKLRDNMRLNVKLFGNQSLRMEPAGVDNTVVYDMSSIISTAANDNSTFAGRKSDGTYGVRMGHPVSEALMDSESFGKSKGTYFVTNLNLEWNIIKDLKFTGGISYILNNSIDKLFGAEFTCDPLWTFGPTQVDDNYSSSRNLKLEALLDYDKSFGDHHLHILGGASQEKYNNEWIEAFRDNFPSTDLHVINAGSTTNRKNSGNESEWILLSYFGRANYSFREKYLLEGNIRYDGSSRFSQGNRFGLFPSASAGWIISKENFFQVPWISNLKIRGSYGILGNQEIGTYPYQKVLSTGYPYVVGDSKVLTPGIQLRTLPFAGITWESTRISDVGFDIGVFSSKINLSVDYYDKVTYDILYNLTVTRILGMSVGAQNAGKVGNKGWDFDLSYKNTIGNFSYGINTNFSVNHNEVLSLAGIERDVDQGLFVGYPLTSMYGYETDGLFVDQADVDNYPTQNFITKPGYPRYKDINGPDGTPDGRVSADYDRTVIGSQFPKYWYGFSATANYKGFDFFMQLQGQAGLKKMIQGQQLAFYNNGNLQQWQVDERWTEENPDRNAAYPRLELIWYDPPFEDKIEYWLQDASFLRVKSIQLGYNIPSKILNGIGINQFRVYLQGENVTTFDHYRPGWDPEMQISGGYNITYYPPARLWSLGINVKF
jgi:TonB-linked SusC/RagA family outer membrane protein